MFSWVGWRRRNSKKHTPSNKPAQYQLRVEELEQRELLATVLPSTVLFDFGTGSSPLASGYTRASLTAYNATAGYGWQSKSGMNAVSRSATDPLTRDFHAGKDRTFLVNLPNGTYYVTPVLGDANAVRDRVSMWMEGTQVASQLTSTAGQFIRTTYVVQVSDGQLTLRLADSGGANANFAINGLEIRPLSGSSSSALVANAGPNYTATAGTAVAFTGSASGGTSPYTYTWNFGDGTPTSTLANPIHTYTTAGNYTATLTVRDGQNVTSQDSATVTINSLPATQGQVFYVSTTGSNTNSGSLTQPFRTIAYAAGQLQPGDTLYLRGGTYAEAINDNLPSGTSAERITISAYNGETVILKPSGVLYNVRLVATVQYLTFNGLVFDGTNIGDTSVYFGGSATHIRVQNSEIRNAPGQGVFLGDGANYHEFINNRIHDNGRDDFDHGLYFSSNNNLVEGNDIYRNAGWGVHIYMGGGVNGVDAQNNVIRNNRVHDNARVGNRGAGIGIYTGNNNLVYNNLVWGNNRGIVADYGASNTGIYNNTVYDNSGDAGILIGAESTGARVKNNIVYQNAVDLVRNYGSGTISDRNLVGADPLFLDPANFNFHLRSGSSAINAGTNLTQFTTDMDGRTRTGTYDIGAYEY